MRGAVSAAAAKTAALVQKMRCDSDNRGVDRRRRCTADAVMARSPREMSRSRRCESFKAVRRRTKPTRSVSKSGSPFGGTSTTMALALLLALASSLPSARANIIFGGVTSTDACYDALRNSRLPGEERIDKEGFVDVVNELSGDAFTAFQKGPSGDWGNYPVTSFDQLPSELRGEFYRHACGGPLVICESAYLYTDGVDARAQASAQQEVYLFQVCVGVEDAIEEAKPKPATTKPTDAPTKAPTPSPREELTLTYWAVASAELSTQELQSTESVERAELLGAMNKWSFMTAAKYDAYGESQGGSTLAADEQGGAASPGSRLRRGGRKLEVTAVPLLENPGEELISIVDVACSPDMNNTLQPGDHCIEVTSNLTLVFRNEPPGTQQDAVTYFENQFERDIADDTYYNLIGGMAREEIRAPLYLPGSAPAVDVPAPTPGEPQTPPNIDRNPFPEGKPMSKPSAQSAEDILAGLLKQEGGTVPGSGDGGGGNKPNVGAIAGGVIVGLFALGLIFFAYRRVKNRSDDFSKDSGSYKKREFDDPADDLEGGRPRASGDASSSSRDELSSSSSQSSGSMQSYSGSETSSRTSKSSYSSSGSRSRYSSSYASSQTGSKTSKSTPDNSGPTSVSESETDSYASGDHDPNSPYGGLAAARAAPALAPRNALYSDPNESASSSNYSMSDPNAMFFEDRSSSSKGSAPGDRPDLLDRSPSRSRSSKGTATGDDSSEGSSGWDSSSGDSSEGSESVESFDPNTIRTGGDSSTPSNPSYGDDLSQDYGGGGLVNPAIMPVVQPGVTLLPVEETSESETPEDQDTTMTGLTPISEGSDDSSNIGRRRDQAPFSGEIEDAIEKGDWAAVEATAAILASSGSSAPEGSKESNVSDSHRSAESGASSDLISVDSAAAESSGAGSDDIRASEIDQLVEDGNWDGVVAVAARYADEADEADESLGRPLREHDSSGSRSRSNSRSPQNEVTASRHNSLRSEGSVSIETADATSVFSNTTRDSVSRTTYSMDETMSDTMTGDGGSTMSGTDSRTPPDAGTIGSSTITSSYVSGAVTESMVSAVSTVDLQEKRQMNAYRAEVEALVRRVVPDEIDNVDDIMVQFSGREEELIETLRAMQEKSIAQRARAAVQRSAKQGAARSGRGTQNDDESSYGQSFTSDGQSVTTDGQSFTTDGPTTRSGSRVSSSVTDQFTQGTGDDFSSGSGSSGSGSRGGGSSYSSSYSSSFSDSRRSGVSGSEFSDSQLEGSIGIISVEKSPSGDDKIKASPGLSKSIDASEWRAVRESGVQPGGDKSASTSPSRSTVTGLSRETQDEMDDMIDQGNWTGVIDAANNMTGGHADDLD